MKSFNYIKSFMKNETFNNMYSKRKFESGDRIKIWNNRSDDWDFGYFIAYSESNSSTIISINDNDITVKQNLIYSAIPKEKNKSNK